MMMYKVLSLGLLLWSGLAGRILKHREERAWVYRLEAEINRKDCWHMFRQPEIAEEGHWVGDRISGNWVVDKKHSPAKYNTEYFAIPQGEHSYMYPHCESFRDSWRRCEQEMLCEREGRCGPAPEFKGDPTPNSLDVQAFNALKHCVDNYPN